MANLQVTLVQLVKTTKGWRRFPVEVERKGRGVQEKLIHGRGERILALGKWKAAIGGLHVCVYEIDQD